MFTAMSKIEIYKPIYGRQSIALLRSYNFQFPNSIYKHFAATRL
jgi:hypothetical protein